MTLIDAQPPFAPQPPPPQDLYAKRRQIYPKLAHGKFRMLKWAALILALAVYYILPWVRWDRGPSMPDQAVLADFASERFYFFSIVLWPQEVYFITGLLILASLGLFLVTALFGRAWCGYACPQTVWTDLYIWVERAFEGDRAARMRLDKAGWSFNKAWRKFGKHTIWLVIAFWTGGAFILYWHDAPTVAQGWFSGEAPLTAYFFAGVLTFTTYVLAGTMREQVCTYLCPWPRIQGALTDEHALNVMYRYDRGEPRAPLRKGEDWDGRGDCIECDQCVQVCPMGIDIRDGDQLECIHCALCIDACDQMMKKIDRPTGLIAYDTSAAVQARALGQTPRYTFFRPRTLLYAALLAVVAGVMLAGLSTRSTFDLSILKDRSPPFVQLSDGGVRNGYSLKLINKTGEEKSVLFSIDAPADYEIEVIGEAPISTNQYALSVEANGVDRYRVVINAPADETARRRLLTWSVQDSLTDEVHSKQAPFDRGEAR
ncbi:MAG: cytochrome c oxidase accessory protein CcoG [Pseudomonadota bacterium]